MLCWPRVFVPKRWIILLMDTTVRQWTGDWACHLIILCFSCFWINREKTYHCCSVTQSHPALCNHMDCSMPGFTVLHRLLEFGQIHAHWVSDAIQPSCSLFFPSLLAFNRFPHQGLFQWVGSLHQVAKVLQLQFQHPMNIQGWFLLGLTGLISLVSKGL